MGLKRGIVVLEDYNLDWVNQFNKEKEVLEYVLGNFVLEIHHVGSTAISGLKAKPIIDILMVIDSFCNIDKVEEILKEYDYTNMGMQGISDRYFFAKGSDDNRTHYLHIVDMKGNTYYNQILFRDYLNKYPMYVKKYCDLKQELANKYADDRKKYTALKAEFISDVIGMAKEEFNIK
jgi:GrpB-like predicted nucleotidyltransferase (UPF0157 family)